MVGWLWYLGTLVPVIGLVQVGDQARADRYTYIPLIGIFIIVSWGMADLARRKRLARPMVAFAATTVACFSLLAWHQVAYWRSSATLWRHAVEATEGSALAHGNLGVALLEEGNVDGAIPEFEEALRLDPEHTSSHSNLGMVLLHKGRADAAIPHLRQAVRLAPTVAAPHMNLGLAYIHRGEGAQAAEQFRQAQRLDPENTGTYLQLGQALMLEGKMEEAAEACRQALTLDPTMAQAHYLLGLTHQKRAAWSEAAACYRRAAHHDPGNADYHRHLAFSLSKQGRHNEAHDEYRQSLKIDPGWPQRSLLRAWVLATHPDQRVRNGNRALEEAEQVRQATDETNPTVLDTLAAACAELGRYAEAVNWARKALTQAAGKGPLEKEIREHLRLYESGQPCRHIPGARQ
jgi:tetratricopeptide (TPR) repeat protein